MDEDIYLVPEQAPLIILDIKSDVCVSKNGKDIKQTRHPSRIMHIATFKIKCGVREFYILQALEPIILGRTNLFPD